MMKPRQVSPPPPPPKELGEYHLPGWDLLDDAEHGYAETQEKFVREQAAVLEQALKEFDIDAHVVEIDTGPVITMYEIALAPGIKVSAISALSQRHPARAQGRDASASSRRSRARTRSASRCPTRRRRRSASRS